MKYYKQFLFMCMILLAIINHFFDFKLYLLLINLFITIIIFVKAVIDNKKQNVVHAIFQYYLSEYGFYFMLINCILLGLYVVNSLNVFNYAYIFYNILIFIISLIRDDKKIY